LQPFQSGPGIKKGKNHNFAFVTDIAATLSDIVFDNVDQRIIGKSLQSSLAGSNEPNYLDSEAIGLEVAGNSALFKGNFKIVRNRPPNGSNEWELYNLSNDPGETLDLAESMPEKLQELIREYEAYAEKNGVIELPIDFDWVKAFLRNTVRRTYLPLILKTIFLIVLLIAIVTFVQPKRKTKTTGP